LTIGLTVASRQQFNASWGRLYAASALPAAPLTPLLGRPAGEDRREEERHFRQPVTALQSEYSVAASSVKALVNAT
jgi:hypothetical protein